MVRGVGTKVRFWGKRMEEPEPLWAVPIPVATGVRSQDVGDLFDGRTTLLALGGILGANVVMTLVIVGVAFSLKIVISVIK